MLEVTKQYRTETAHRLFNYEGKCAHIHGHSYLWEVTATAEKLDSKGMIVDFSTLKKAMESVLEKFDHAFVMNKFDPIAKMPEDVRKALLKPTYPHQTSSCGRVILFQGNPTAEAFAQYAAENIQQELSRKHGVKDTITITHVRVWETQTCHADWHKPTGEDYDGNENTTA